MMANHAMFEDASAKVNLALHVTGVRDDGYHLLESLVVFTEFGDRISGQISSSNSFTITGPFAGQMNTCAAEDNLIIKARNALVNYALTKGITTPPTTLICQKNLPLASGLGGGSADAAATLRLLKKLWELDIADNDLTEIALKLGADIPMCLTNRPLIAKGIGEEIAELSSLPQFALVLVNPLIEVATPDVFSKLASKSNPPFDLIDIPGDLDNFIALLNRYRNDLQAPAIETVPEIGQCLDALSSTEPLFHRMSGSGASCFGVYLDLAHAKDARDRLIELYPNWFVAASRLKGL